MSKRLYKSRTEKVIDGVCGGIAEYFGIDPTLVRLLWIASIFAGGAGIILYIIAMIIIPTEPYQQTQSSQT
ncbi:MAG TPA: PspC domain-containing protein, partial [Petrotogaceae bacterium]|nr:PspC domain-containing protein [Petrotogaceae bacterium]HQC40838.1 PspC domain-containing protein [Petrotogaceae bacterium]